MKYRVFSLRAAVIASSFMVVSAATAWAHDLPSWTPMADVGTQATFRIEKPLTVPANEEVAALFQHGQKIQEYELDMSSPYCLLMISGADFSRALDKGITLKLDHVRVTDEYFQSWNMWLRRTDIDFQSDPMIERLRCYGQRPQGMTLDDMKRVLGSNASVDQGTPKPYP